MLRKLADFVELKILKSVYNEMTYVFILKYLPPSKQQGEAKIALVTYLLNYLYSI